ncbi:MAG: hypothetical protein M3228_07650 [Actinomycetota bacterium]|nr:hypothetical protein [Actinomycetota bacterium]
MEHPRREEAAGNEPRPAHREAGEWERQAGERLIDALGLPDDLRDEAMTALNPRNLLAQVPPGAAVFFGDPAPARRQPECWAKSG